MFQKARIKLTAWYLLIIMMISMTFSVIIYRVLTAEVERFAQIQRFRIERRLLDGYTRFPIPQGNESELVNETKHRIFLALLVINGSIMVLSGIFGYVLAGRTLKPIADMVDEQNRFISDASHELKTPLTSLKSAFEVFLRGKNQTVAEAKTLITESINETNKLQSLSESLLTLTQYQKTGGGSMSMEYVSINTVIKDAIKKITPLATQKKISIRLTGGPVRIKGNAYSLTDLMVLLLDNAIKYSPEKSTVMIRVQKTRDSVTISVVDQGIGISKNDLPHIFNRFYRADSARSKTDAGGYGLGLSIAKQITDTHHGSIHVSSQPGTGTTFTIRIPASFS